MKLLLGTAAALAVLALWFAPLGNTGSAPLPAPTPTPTVRQCLAEDDATTTGQPCMWQGQVTYPSDPTPPAGMTDRDVYTALEECQRAYYFGEIDAPQYLECTKGLYADESRSTDYAWKTGNR